ncbi:hypothetical protein PVK06_041030 [Gossypium arboreum]|uniref:Uncharacterized protein n=1 Tax=Gossypium arboreum TaxID=29729 RepID=A0ABR0N782_GOSAR|nr:hypothetical protein PVK06_041030 [Gossypium arboreum]
MLEKDRDRANNHAVEDGPAASDRSTDFFNEQFLSFADWSTKTAESAVDGSENAFRKLALPDYSVAMVEE